MKNENRSTHPIVQRILLMLWLSTLVMIFASSLPQTAYAGGVTTPPVPANIQVPAGHKAYLVGQAIGTQNYVCLPADTGVKFTLFTPQATLFSGHKQVTTHYFSPNPAENGTIRATWQHSHDTSTVWGQVKEGNASTDPAFVAPGAIPWLLITVVGTQEGATGGNTLTATTFIQRVNTAGGVAPATGCTSSADVGKQAFVPYTTDYIFYKQAPGNGAAQDK